MWSNTFKKEDKHPDYNIVEDKLKETSTVAKNTNVDNDEPLIPF